MEELRLRWRDAGLPPTDCKRLHSDAALHNEVFPVSEERIAIVGGGQAGFQVASDLAERSERRYAITLLCEEPELPYQRPPLSKRFLDPSSASPALSFRDAAYYADCGVAIHRDCKAVRIHRNRKSVEVASGRQFAYDRLIIATGSRPRVLTVGGTQPSSLSVLRTLADARRLRDDLGAVSKVAIVGGGFIGLEIAATLSQRPEVRVMVFEAAPRVLARSVAPEISEYIGLRHRRWGTEVLTDARIEAIEPGENSRFRLCWSVSQDPSPSRPQTHEHAFDLVLACVGSVPETTLAEGAGLAVDGGIVVDAHLQTTDSSIFAIGDCARFPRASDGTPVRMESVQNALDQARSLAQTLDGRPTPYRDTPWFWSDQRDIKLQMVGERYGDEAFVLRGDPETDRFSYGGFRQGRLVCVESVNKPADHVASRRLIALGLPLSPEEFADHRTPLKRFLRRPGIP